MADLAELGQSLRAAAKQFCALTLFLKALDIAQCNGCLCSQGLDHFQCSLIKERGPTECRWISPAVLPWLRMGTIRANAHHHGWRFIKE